MQRRQGVLHTHLRSAGRRFRAADIDPPDIRALRQAGIAHPAFGEPVVNHDPGGCSTLMIDGLKRAAALLLAAQQERIPAQAQSRSPRAVNSGMTLARSPSKWKLAI